mmetsp:Transcript_21350/g.30549  ORF Transcript_21350/g.30549 Transcript_21350/m.30549 type:complete len:1538 (+) Transcript_21350:1841-6454(+)
MSTLGDSPSRQGVLLGEAKRPQWRKRVGHKIQNKEEEHGKIYNYFKPKRTIVTNKPAATVGVAATPAGKATKVATVTPCETSQALERKGDNKKDKRDRRAQGFRRPPKRKKRSEFTVTYSKLPEATRKKMPAREAQGEIPSYTLTQGVTSTTFGHKVETIDNRSVFRALYQNPNGINPHPGNLAFHQSLQECYDNCVSLIGLAETNREWGKPEQQRQLRDGTHKIWRASTIQTSATIDPFEENYKPGGTLTIVCEDHWVCRVLEKGDDPWGLARWSYVILGGKGNTKVLQVTGYRVCASTESAAGETTAFKQQFNILRERMEGKIDPRRQGTMDMQTWLMHYIAQGIGVILYLDGNEDIKGRVGSWVELTPYTPGIHASHSDHNGSLATLVTTCGLVDVMAEQHSKDLPPTYTRGKKRIDYVFVTPRLMGSVLRSSMLPFHTMFGGDHRPLLIDFDAVRLFGDTSHEIQRPKASGLKLQDPRVVNKYIDKVIQQLEYHKIQTKVEALQEASLAGQWNSKCIRIYEVIGKIITESDIYADRAVAKRYSEKYEWSPALLRVVDAVRYWTLRLKKAKGVPVDEVLIKQHREAAHLPLQQSEEITKLIDIVNKYLRDARKLMYQSQANHVELRRTFLEELAEAITVDKRTWLIEDGREQKLQEAKEKKLKELIKREEVRKMHRTIGFLLKQDKGQGLLQVDIPDATAVPPPGETFGDIKDPKTWRGPWVSITEPEEMAEAIAKANIRNFHQAHNTPFANGPIGRAIGLFADTSIADDILKGMPIPEAITGGPMEETKRMLNVIGTPPVLVNRELKTEITANDFRLMYKAVGECKSSSPSTIHVGHYMAATKSDFLSWLYAAMMTFPYSEGFSPERWQVVLDVMLPKEPHNWKISRLRIIQLYESDANQSMRHLFARQMGYIMEDSNIVPEMQFGSRPGRMSISAVIQKQLTYDIARLAKTVLGCEENDAISCYDRIANRLGYLLLRRLGMPLQAIRSLGTTWANMTHVIRTAYGKSKSLYRSTRRIPLYGSTNGPFFWLLMFTIMADSIDPSLRVLLFISACAALLASRPRDAFVDDSHVGVTSSHEDVPDLSMENNLRLHELQVLEDLTKLAQHYERLLWSTGGALNIKKCSWVLISWIWKNGRAKLATIQQAPGEIKLTSGDSTEKQVVPRMQPTETYRTLGVFINGSSNTKQARDILRGHAATYAGKIGPAYINPVTAYHAFQLYLSPKLGYALPASMFSFKDCVYIQAPALMVTLPKLKLNRNTARAIIHGENRFGGLSMTHTYCEQGHGQTRLFLGHLRNRDHTGELILIAMSYLQIISGSTKLFLNLPFGKYSKWIEHTWLTSLWAFLIRVNLTVDIRKAWTPEPQRQGDGAIMTIFIESGYSGKDLAQLNRCRLYVQVFFISDVATADGKYIDEKYRQRIKNPERVSTWKWPAQGIPDRQAWRLWDKALGYIEQDNKLRVPLGKWLRRPHQTWEWQFHPPTGIVRRKTKGQPTSYYRAGATGITRRTSQMFSLSSMAEVAEDDTWEWAAVTQRA